MTRAAPALVLGLLLPVSGGEEIHVRGGGGKWRPVAAEGRDGTLSVTITPADTDGGRALIVLRKPRWMVLEDETPPVLHRVTTEGRPVEVGEGLALRSSAGGPVLRLALEDGSNPVDVASLVARLDGQVFATKAPKAPPARRAEATLDLSSLGSGAYEGFLEAADMSPSANVLRMPLRVVVDGVRRHPDGQTVTLCLGGSQFIVGGEGKGLSFVCLGDTGAAAYLTTEVGGRFVYPRRTVAIEDLPNERGVRLVADVIGIENQDFGQIARLEFDLDTDPDFPGLLVTSRSVNLDADGEVYCFWGWLPGSGYVTPEGEKAWRMVYETVGKCGWVYLTPGRAGGPGIGLISPLVFGESRFGTMLLYTDPTRLPVRRGEAVGMKLAIMLTDGPEKVAAAYETLRIKPWFE